MILTTEKNNVSLKPSSVFFSSQVTEKLKIPENQEYIRHSENQKGILIN